MPDCDFNFLENLSTQFIENVGEVRSILKKHSVQAKFYKPYAQSNYGQRKGRDIDISQNELITGNISEGL